MHPPCIAAPSSSTSTCRRVDLLVDLVSCKIGAATRALASLYHATSGNTTQNMVSEQSFHGVAYGLLRAAGLRDRR